MYFALLSATLAVELWTIPKMNCQNCIKDIKKMAKEVDGLTVLNTSMIKQQLCFSGKNAKALEEKIKAKGYKITEQKQPEKCPSKVRSPWAGATGEG